ncbi:unnamed protein product [Spirodela intermedia]|uniref:Reverse transcriptase Ty1/copia-type domain-containing protein n=1 Tax=Spirodela intermedia TaxID=51605 RepID=A0A7I8JLZ4_SPIIN|nr:unnamed protein product [Spirodela intermedia]CAA6671188.1 unnamed protein product [Spirodela intermedia]
MTIPPGYPLSNQSKVVCRLKKALYGLKQSPRAYQGYKQSNADHTLFIKHNSCGGMTVLIVYVNDILITSDDTNEIQNLISWRLRYFLGIEVAHSKEGIFISQHKYTVDLLQETRQLACKPIVTPVDINVKLGAGGDSPPVNKESFQRLIEKLIYLNHTRPNVAYAVSSSSQFMNDPREIHLQAAYHILPYLKNTIGQGLLFSRGGDSIVEIYTDANDVGSVSDRRSTSGYCSFVVSKSSAEAEFKTMAQGICEAIWIKILLEDLHLYSQGCIKLYCDNQSAIAIAHNPVQHDRTKYIEIDPQFIKEKIEEGMINLMFINCTNQVANIFTKGPPGPTLQKLVFKLGMSNIHTQLAGGVRQAKISLL